MDVLNNNIWKTIPSLRIVIGLILGILLEYYFNTPLLYIYFTIVVCFVILLLHLLVPLKFRFKINSINGIAINILCVSLGAMLVFYNNIEHQKQWIGNTYQEGNKIQITLQEPLVLKNNFYKAIASIDAIEIDHKWTKAIGGILVYIRKDSTSIEYGYGSTIITNATLNTISNAGNPGGFNYTRYCFFQGITHQVFINQNQYIYTGNRIPSKLYYCLFKIRDHVLNSLKLYLPDKGAYSIGEALLIGYRNDLDTELVQAYSNTGVVHIIAISGMHLGMLYGTLILFFNLIPRKKWVVIVKPIVILTILWGFTLIAGAVPSILRSAFMFTFILFSEIFNKKSKIYNTLSLSALCMIVYNPFCIWDVGFQLSYAAVLSIIMFSKNVSGWFVFKNKILHYIWNMNAVTISAQVWTFPLIIYYFHQFPRLVLISNLVVVPLSCIILYGEIFLLFIGSLATSAGILFGKLIQLSINGMNLFIIKMSALKLGTWEGIKVTPLQTIFLFCFITFLSIWLLYKSKKHLFIAIVFLLVTVSIRFIDYLVINQQHQLIVYNIPKYSTIEVSEGNYTNCYSDTGIDKNSFLYNFHIKPAHINNRTEHLTNFAIPNYLELNNTRIVILNRHIKANINSTNIAADMVILSHNPGIPLQQIVNLFNCNKIVIDGSNSMWKTQIITNENEGLHLPLYNTQSNGAFIKEL